MRVEILALFLHLGAEDSLFSFKCKASYSFLGALNQVDEGSFYFQGYFLKTVHKHCILLNVFVFVEMIM